MVGFGLAMDDGEHRARCTGARENRAFERQNLVIADQWNDLHAPWSSYTNKNSGIMAWRMGSKKTGHCTSTMWQKTNHRDCPALVIKTVRVKGRDNGSYATS